MITILSLYSIRACRPIGEKLIDRINKRYQELSHTFYLFLLGSNALKFAKLWAGGGEEWCAVPKKLNSNFNPKINFHDYFDKMLTGVL